jgi:hypothetical protein
MHANEMRVALVFTERNDDTLITELHHFVNG